MKSDLPKRRLIPKWRPVAATLLNVESHAVLGKESLPQGNPEAAIRDFDDAVALWRETKAPGVLGDVLSFSVDVDLQGRVLAIGKEALASGAKVTLVQSQLIQNLDAGNQIQNIGAPRGLNVGLCHHPFQEPIRRLRSLLRTAPDNALALLDYAQLQAANGKLKAADRSIRTALDLAPNNRIVLRTAARFYVHDGQKQLAHHLIQRHPRTVGDPWLMASEIALADAAGVDAFFLSKGKRFLFEQTRYPIAHLTELSGVVAMSELRSGNLKKAREAQRKALLAPNDNLIAHAIDLQPLFGITLDGPKIAEAISKSNEARVLLAWLKLDPEGVKSSAMQWHSEEPFSSRPIQLLSFIYANQGEHQTAIEWIRVGLMTDHKDQGLLTNLAFVQACMGKIPESRQTLRLMRHLFGQTVEPFIKATEGLIAYTQGHFEVGDTLYDDAVALFESAKHHHIAAYCRVNQARVVVDCGHPKAEDIVKRAGAAFKMAPSLDSSMLLKLWSTPDIQVSGQSAEQRLLGQWIFDPHSNTLTHKPGITAVGARAVVLRKQ